MISIYLFIICHSSRTLLEQKIKIKNMNCVWFSKGGANGGEWCRKVKLAVEAKRDARGPAPDRSRPLYVKVSKVGQTFRGRPEMSMPLNHMAHG